MAGLAADAGAIVAYGLERGSFDIPGSGTSDNHWIFLGFVIAFAVKAPLFPFHGWLPDAYRESSPEVAAVLSGVVSKAAAYGFLRIAIAKFPEPADDFRTPILVLAACGLVYGSLLAFRAPDIRGVIAYSSLAQMGLITIGIFAFDDLGRSGAVLQMVNHGLVSAALFLLAGRVERRAATGELGRSGRDGPRETRACDRADDDRRDRARRAGLGRVRGRVPDPARRLRHGLGLGRRRRRRDRARGDVHAAADLGGAAPGRRPGGAGGGPRPSTRGARGDRAPRRVSARALGLAGGDQRSRSTCPSDGQASRRLVRALAVAGAARGRRARAPRSPCSLPRAGPARRSRRSSARSASSAPSSLAGLVYWKSPDAQPRSSPTRCAATGSPRSRR